MGSQFSLNSIPRNIIIMKFLIGLSLVAFAVGAPLELTPEVAEATKAHLAAHAAALAGEHAALAPVQGPAFYLADDAAVAAAKPYLADTAEVAAAKPYLPDAADVAAAKVEFQKYFDAAAAGTPLTPVTLPALKVVAPVAPVATVPATYYTAHVPYYHAPVYAHHYAAYPYYTGYAGLPVWTAPVVAAPAAEEPVVAAEE